MEVPTFKVKRLHYFPIKNGFLGMLCKNCLSPSHSTIDNNGQRTDRSPHSLALPKLGSSAPCSLMSLQSCRARHGSTVSEEERLFLKQAWASASGISRTLQKGGDTRSSDKDVPTTLSLTLEFEIR